MANFGRFICVALPFLLTLASLVALLVGGLAGVMGNKDTLYMFRVNTTDLSVRPTDLAGIVSGLTGRDLKSGFHDAAALAEKAAQNSGTSGSAANNLGNITAAQLGLHKVYDVSLWGYCYEPQSGDRACLTPKFNWAQTEINNTMSNLKALAAALGRNVTIPKSIDDGLEVFSTVARWTQIVFIIAYVTLGVALILGIAANFSRAISCLVWVISGLATAATIAAASMATATAVVVVGTVEATAKWYGVRSGFNTGFLAAVWIAVAFALAAGFFWLFTVCCCKPDRSSSKRHSDTEKLVPKGGAAYSPLNDSQNNAGFYNQSQTAYGAPRYPQGGRSDLAYEPYSHGR